MFARSNRNSRGIGASLGKGFALLIAVLATAFLTACEKGSNPFGEDPIEISTPTPTPVPETPTPSPTPTPTGGSGTVAVIHVFVAEPLSIDSGGSSTLRWEVADATSVEIDHGIGSVSLNGTRSVSPTGTTTYHLTAHGTGGDATATAQVTVNSAPPATCVPTLNSPASGATLDNGRTDHSDDIVWDFDWSSCTGATQYHLYVIHSGASLPAIDKDDIGSSSYHHVNSGAYISSSSLNNWTWKVRARVGGVWGDWSPARSFKVEPPDTAPPATCVPTLNSPASGATLDNGRTDHSDDIVWDFDWSSCSGATQYHLYVIHSGASIPAIDRDDLGSSSYHHVNSGAYISSSNLNNWTWKVRARIGGVWGSWSPARSFKVEPPDTDPNPSAVCVPSLVSPASGATLDNGRTNHTDDIVWNFDWSACSGATQYHLYVIHSGASIPVIDKNNIGSSSYHHVSSGSYIASSSLTNWTWRVRARVGGLWGDWSPTRSFKVEPPDTD